MPGLDESRAPAGTYRVEGFRGGAFLIAGRVREGAVLLWRSGVEEAPRGIDAESFEPLFSVEPPIDVILIGTGAKLSWPDPALLEKLRSRGIGVEAMASEQAARTYNLLVAEGRQAAALLLPLQA
jgi:uncharacterized protein